MLNLSKVSNISFNQYLSWHKKQLPVRIQEIHSTTPTNTQELHPTPMKNSLAILLMEPQLQSIPWVLHSDPQPELVPAQQLQALHPYQPPLEKTLGWYFRKSLFLFTLLTLLVVEWRATYRENLYHWDLQIQNPSRNPWIYGHSVTMPTEAVSTE